MSAPATPAPNCPFYGRHLALELALTGLIPGQTLLFRDSGGNQCALRVSSYTPCDFAVERKPVDWHVCSVWAAATRGPLEKL